MTAGGVTAIGVVGIVLDVWNENAGIPGPVMHGVLDDAKQPALGLDRSAPAVAQHDMAHRARRRWVTQQNPADGRGRFANGNLLAQSCNVRLESAGIGIRLGRRHGVVDAAIQDVSFLEDQPGNELGAVPWSLVIRVILRDEHVAVFFMEMLARAFQQTRTRGGVRDRVGRHRRPAALSESYRRFPP